MTHDHSPKGAIVFLLDSSFLDGLKGFIKSASLAMAHKTEDILIISDDERLLDDPFVKDLADKTILITPEEVEKFRVIDLSNVDGKHLNHESGSYWFLKFCMFRDYGYDYHICIDADVICMSDDFRFSDIDGDGDLAICRAMGPGALKLKGWDDRPFFTRSLVSRRIKRKADKKYKSLPPVNSGVMRIKKPLIGEDTFVGLLALASNAAYSLEQQVVQAYVTKANFKIVILPFWFNFTMLASVSIGPRRFQKLAKENIKILHFNRPKKPWQRSVGEKDWLDAIWDETAIEK